MRLKLRARLTRALYSKHASQIPMTQQEIILLTELLAAQEAQKAKYITPVTEADPLVLDTVINQARDSRDGTDYLRILSTDKNVNSIARNLALPALLASNAMFTTPAQEGTRQAVLNTIRNLQAPRITPA